MSEKGTYQGKDGRTYRVSINGADCIVVYEPHKTAAFPKVEDLDAYLAALAELKEAEEWVEIDSFYRCDITGEHQQVRACTRDAWDELCVGETYDIFTGFRAGLATGRAQAKELAEAVGAAHSGFAACLYASERRPALAQWGRIVE
jgi:hypothetical protein